MIDKLIDFVIGVIDLFRFWQVIDADEEGVVLTLGNYSRSLSPGIHWLAPFGIQEVRKAKVTPDTFNLSAQGLTTKDGQQITVALIVNIRIVDIRKALLEVSDYSSVLQDCALSQCAQLVQSNDWEVVRSAEFADAMTKASRRPAFKYGVEIVSVAFSDVTTTFNLTQMQVG